MKGSVPLEEGGKVPLLCCLLIENFSHFLLSLVLLSSLLENGGQARRNDSGAGGPMEAKGYRFTYIPIWDTA